MEIKQDKKHQKNYHKKVHSVSNIFQSSRKTLSVGDIFARNTSSFKLKGKCNINCSDLQKREFKLRNMPPACPLEAHFTASLCGDVKFTSRTDGFLTVGIENRDTIFWSNRWCVLEGGILRYWNYPSEELNQPVGTIDLKYATEKVSPADRSICPRSKSLCLITKNSEDIIIKYFLVADTQETEKNWLQVINFVIGTLDSWKRLCPCDLVSSL